MVSDGTIRSIDWQTATIERVVEENYRVKTFTFRLPSWRRFRSGQHYDVRLTAPDGETYFRELYTSFFGPQAAPQLVETAVEEACRTPVEVRVKEISLMASDSLTPASAMTQPTLVIAGLRMTR